MSYWPQISLVPTDRSAPDRVVLSTARTTSRRPMMTTREYQSVKSHSKTKTDLFDKDEIWRKKKCLKTNSIRQNFSDSSKWKPATGQPIFGQSNRLAPVQSVQPARSVATIPGSSQMTVQISSPYQPTNSPYQPASGSYQPATINHSEDGGVISDSGSEDWFDVRN